MTDDDDKQPPEGTFGVHARLNPPPHKTEEAVAEYKARQEAERARMVRLRELRLAAEAKAAGKPKAKQKLGGKGEGTWP